MIIADLLDVELERAYRTILVDSKCLDDISVNGSHLCRTGRSLLVGIHEEHDFRAVVLETSEPSGFALGYDFKAVNGILQSVRHRSLASISRNIDLRRLQLKSRRELLFLTPGLLAGRQGAHKKQGAQRTANIN